MDFHIIGTGACGFLRMYYYLMDQISLVYKGSRRLKYQNSFEYWDDNNGLQWDSESLSKEERLRRVSKHDTVTNITHSYLKYVPEFIELHPDMKFLCLKGQKDHSIKSLFTSWGYRNPCYVSNRKTGLGHNRYAVPQFPNLSDSKDELEATERYWNEYYEIADKYSKEYPNNFHIIDAPKFFSDKKYRTSIMNLVNLNIDDEPLLPIDFDSCEISTTLHGGIGNNLFQIAECLSFCKKYDLPEPVFGIWNLWEGGGMYPKHYNSDILFAGHNGSSEDIKSLFPNLNWSDDLHADFDTKFIINDMFMFSDCDRLEYIRDTLSVTKKSNPNTASLHLRYCTLSADNHVNGYVDDSFYERCLNDIPDNVHVYIFSDDNNKANRKLEWFTQNFPHKFEVVEKNCFESLKLMAECEYHILHVSTFSFWSAFLDIKQPNNKVFYSKSFIDGHQPTMIPYKEWNLV